MPGINTWERIHALSHVHAAPRHRSPLTHFELPRCQEVNAATTEWIYAERTMCIANPISSSLDTCKQPKSNMLFHTHAWWDIPLTRPQHQIIRFKGKTWVYTVWRQCLEVFFHPDKNQSQALTLLSPQFPEALHGKAAGRAAAEGRGGPPDPLGEFGLF